jgi:septum formation protein
MSMMAEPGRPEVVLASASVSRRRLLEAAGLSFRVVPSEVDEGALKRRLAAQAADPEVVADALARTKAESVSARMPQALVIGADQVLALEDELFDKPRDLAAARAQLIELRGKTHRLLTAVSLALGGNAIWHSMQPATLTMRPFSDEFLEQYLAIAGANVAHSVGAYELEGLGIQLFERVEGDYFAILGLPLLPLLAELRARGAIVA